MKIGPSLSVVVSVALALASATAANAIVVVDQETGAERFRSGLRVEYFIPVGQSFVPTLSRHMGVKLFLSNPSLCACPNPDQPPAIFTVNLREASLAGPIRATGTTQPFDFPALSMPDWVEIPFDEPVSLLPGDTYFLEVRTANQAGFWYRAGQDPYPDGVAYVRGAATFSFDWGFMTLANKVDAFQCYEAKTPEGFASFEGLEVGLSDQFAETVEVAKRGEQLCAPVDVDGAGIADPEAHLMCYDISGKSRWESFEVRVSNQFGSDQILVVKEPKSLCVPSTKEHVESNVAPGDPSALALDHFRCYGVEIPKDSPRFEPFEVAVSDQFRDSNRLVKKPKSLCTPVDKNGEGILDPSTHLTCYEVKQLEGEPKPRDLKLSVLVSNQFGEEQSFTVKKPRTVCVPSVKELVNGTPAACSAIEDGEFGLCRAIIGWGINSRTGQCAPVSGCGCDERCDGRVFRDEATCLRQCGGQ